MSLDEKVRKEIEKREIPSYFECGAAINPEKYRKFLLHDCKRIFPSRRVESIEGYSYKFTETSIGTGIIASCPCGYEEDLTDYSSW